MKHVTSNRLGLVAAFLCLTAITWTTACSRSNAPFMDRATDDSSVQKDKIDQGKSTDTPAAVAKTYREEAKTGRDLQKSGGIDSIVSAGSRQLAVEKSLSPLTVNGKGRIGILYFKDRPAHRLAVVNWLTSHGATINFESENFGYIDADLTWTDIGGLIATSGSLGLEETSFLKLEIDEVSTGGTPNPNSHSSQPNRVESPSLADVNSSFFGPVHSAGYGAQVEEFRAAVAQQMNITSQAVEGQGRTIAVFDQGIDLSRTDVFQDRIRDFFIGDDKDWMAATKTAVEYAGAAAVPFAGLDDVWSESTLRFLDIEESDFNAFDLNGSGSTADHITVAVYEHSGNIEARVRPLEGLAFGDATLDFGTARAQGLNPIVNLYTGKHYQRAAVSPSPSAAGFKLRKLLDGTIQVAIVGTANGSDHGISNLHMAGGNYQDPSASVRYRGVAPSVSFYAMQSWSVRNNEYGEKWIPLARSIIQAADANSDVIDLDIYTPGSRGGSDLLSNLACRITATTDSSLIAASHNYGPLPDTIQSLAQSPCVLAIGASHSVAALRYGRNQGSIDPRLTTDDAVQTAHYSGRGFGMNGQFKPDIISPAYGYTAYGRVFIRFGGTSGATPTTAGMIALLKQAAGMRGQTLNHDQVRFLLQGGSAPLFGADKVRDGYGYSNLLASWNVLTSEASEFGGAAADGFSLTGQSYLYFAGKPNRGVIASKIQRVPSPHSVDGPRAMNFTVDFSGPSPIRWLKFYDASSGQPSDTLATDSPLIGETQNIRYLIDLTDEQYAALPSGDYVAIVKGVRKDFAGNGRAADYLQPVSFTKGRDFDEETFTLSPLFSDQHQMFDVKSSAGERLLFTASPTCLGQDISTGVSGNNSDSLVFTVDHESFYPHASSVMNSYAPLTLGMGGITVDVQKSVVRFDIRRSGQFNCAGPIGGTVTVRRTGLTVDSNSVRSTRNGTSHQVQQDLSLHLNAGTLSNIDLNRGATWKLKNNGSQIVARNDVVGAFQGVVPVGATRIRVIPAKSARFQGVLVTRDSASGAIQQSASTGTGDASGFASINVDFGGDFTGLQIRTLKAGDAFEFVAAGKTAGAGGEATIEIEIERGMLLADSGTELSVTEWLRGQSKGLSFRHAIADPTSLVSGLGDGWSYVIRSELDLVESQANGTGTGRANELSLWTGTVTTPVDLLP